ncbi:MAG: deacylase [Desulfovibrio sp.]|jgi:hypothetical protein|nr:deacylase [Desulfovibrio sp.]
MRAPQKPALKRAGRFFPARTAGLIVPAVLCAVVVCIAVLRYAPGPFPEPPRHDLQAAGTDTLPAANTDAPSAAGPEATANNTVPSPAQGAAPDRAGAGENAAARSSASAHGPQANLERAQSRDIPQASAPGTQARQADDDGTHQASAGAHGTTASPLQNLPPAASENAPAARLPFNCTVDAGRFNLLKMGEEGPTLLVIGGIQGDEPGGFSAAALLASHYRIHKGSVWVVPDLNFPSILQRSRGLFGDMNRKFAALAPSDPEYDTIARIKSILLDSDVDLILNLHDGSGFYRPTWEGPLHNPKRWGQSLIIDQEKMSVPPFLLQETAGHVEVEVNRALLHPGHRYYIHNTLTALGNTEMEKTLSWFSVSNGKPAFGIEASKEFTTEYRSYYHLNVVEAFMRRMGIAFDRDFPLTPEGVLRALNSDLILTAFNDRLVLLLDNVRPVLTRIPFPHRGSRGFRSSKPLLAPVQDGEGWRVAYGNRTLTRIQPEYMEFDESPASFDLLVDGRRRKVSPGEIVRVAGTFQVDVPAGCRVNAIGAQKEVRGSEAGVRLRRQDFMPRFSMDKDAFVYRIEVYRGKAFAGMFLVDFGRAPDPRRDPMTAVAGPESALGR